MAVQVSPVEKKEGMLEGVLMNFGKKMLTDKLAGGFGGAGGEEAEEATDLLGGAKEAAPEAPAGTPGLGAKPGDESIPGASFTGTKGAPMSVGAPGQSPRDRRMLATRGGF